MRSALKYRSGRIIPLCRVTLASAFLVTSLIDPDYPLRTSNHGPAILLGYVALSLVLAAIAWRSWWLNHQLRIATFVIEALIAFGVLFLVEGSPGEQASPFMAMFVFLLVSGTLIWRNKQLIAVTGMLMLGYCATVAMMAAAGSIVDGHWVARRLAFMGVTAALVIWFGYARGKPRAERLDWSIDDSIMDRLSIIGDYVLGHIRASGIGLVWMPEGEPWTYLGTTGSLGDRQDRISPEAFDFSAAYAGEAILFDRERNRALMLTAMAGIVAKRGRLPLSLAEYLDLPSGMIVPISAETGSGALLLVGKQILSPDYLQPAAIIGQEIALALDRHELNVMTKAAEIAAMRDTIARDLHDSVVQTLAGESLRLGVVRERLAQGKDIAADLGVLHESIDQEQRNVQRLIARLHDSSDHANEADLGATIADTLARLGRQWDIITELDMTSTQQLVPEPLAHEFELILREAIANAVRHGKATAASVQARIVENSVRLAISDNGAGFPAVSQPQLPRSIAERVQQLGGTLDIGMNGGTTTLSIVIPGASR